MLAELLPPQQMEAVAVSPLDPHRSQTSHLGSSLPLSRLSIAVHPPGPTLLLTLPAELDHLPRDHQRALKSSNLCLGGPNSSSQSSQRCGHRARSAQRATP